MSNYDCSTFVQALRSVFTIQKQN